MASLPSHLIKLRILAEIPRSQYLDLSGPDDPLDERSRGDFFKRLRSGSSKTKGKGQPVYSAACENGALTLDVAVWLKFMLPPRKPVSLWLHYEDQTGESLVLVDEQNLAGSLESMLSGSVHLEVKGAIKKLQAGCAGIGDNEIFAVEELMVQRKQAAASVYRSAHF